MSEKNNIKYLKKIAEKLDLSDLTDQIEMLTQIHRPKDFIEENIRMDDMIIQMEYAYSWAKRRCYAKRRKVGAILYKNGRPISSGFNGTKSGYPNNSDDSPPYNKLLKARVLFA